MRRANLPTAHEYHLGGCLFICSAGVILLGIFILVLSFITREDWTASLRPVGYIGDPARGRALVSMYGCPSCHTIPAQAPHGAVGPPLEQMGSRSYIAGRFPNEEIWMTLWLEHPQNLKRDTAMPDLNVGRRDALDMAAYLATLR